MTKILSARKPAVLGGLLFRWHEVPRRKKLYGITLKPGGDVVVRYNRITARRATFAGKPERDGRASLLAFIAALDSFGILQRVTFHQQIVARLWRFL